MADLVKTDDVVIAPGGTVGVVAGWVDAVEVVFFDGSSAVLPCETLQRWTPGEADDRLHCSS